MLIKRIVHAKLSLVAKQKGWDNTILSIHFLPTIRMVSFSNLTLAKASSDFICQHRQFFAYMGGKEDG
jgi:hypothetical protein